MINDDKPDLAILMPTQNRPLFVKRALSFYKQELLPYKIHLLDSSKIKNKTALKEIVKLSGLDIDIHDHDYINGASSFNKFDKALDSIDTEYVLMIADDDFIFPNAITQCVDFLSCHPNYTAASGRSYLFELHNASNHGEIDFIKPYPQFSAENNLAEHRYRSHMRNWTTMAYSVQRTDNLKEIIVTHRQFCDDIRMMEIHWYATNVIRGKVATLDIPYMFRQGSLSKEWSVEGLDWSKTLGFSDKRELLISLLASELERSGSKSNSYYSKICATALNGWIKARRPFSLKNCFNYSMGYYWTKFNEKTGRNTLVRDDLAAVERIKLAVSRQGIET